MIEGYKHAFGAVLEELDDDEEEGFTEDREQSRVATGGSIDFLACALVGLRKDSSWVVRPRTSAITVHFRSAEMRARGARGVLLSEHFVHNDVLHFFSSTRGGRVWLATSSSFFCSSSTFSSLLVGTV